jgi:hypothetical protein
VTALQHMLRRGAGGFGLALSLCSVSSLAQQTPDQQILVQQTPAQQTPDTSDTIASPQPTPTANSVQSAGPLTPEVTYHDGQLAIRSQGSTLAEVLKAVAQKTGAVIEVPAGGGLERVFERAGPANTDAVLRGLLTGSDFNFVILTPPQTPHKPARVLLFARVAGSAGADDSAVAAAEGSPGNEPQLYGAGFVVSSDDESAAEAAPPPAAEPDKPDALPGPVLDQMQKDFLKQHELQRQQQRQQQEQQGGSPPSQ